MSFFDSLLISFFGLGLLFVVLIGLSAAISIESKVLNLFGLKNQKNNKGTSDSAVSSDKAADLPNPGELKLIEVDERTAAMIMAIVSEESGISLSELQFKSIKALD